jgi:hypothetical protein
MSPNPPIAARESGKSSGTRHFTVADPMNGSFNPQPAGGAKEVSRRPA